MASPPPTRRVRPSPRPRGIHLDASEPLSIRPHPYNVRPLGSLLLAAPGEPHLRAAAGALGILSSLHDELLLRLLSHLDAASLVACGRASRAMRAFCAAEELWKALVIDSMPPALPLRFAGSWRLTYARRVRADVEEASAIRAPPLYSDALFAPWFCGTAALPRAWSARENVPRLDGTTLSVADFVRRFESPGVPVVLTNLTTQWRAHTSWSEQSLRARFGGTLFHVGGLPMALSDFFDYAHSTTDEMPLYLFDKHFAAAAPPLAEEYAVPPHFAPRRDLFERLPRHARPDHRWLIVGGPRSGSSWHVDPNATSAWNACVVGAKKWVLCPPHAPPPGVTPSADGGSVTCPVSLYEWFRVFHSSLGEGAREVTLRAGEILFVPRGWWHTAINLETTVAITQNYAPRCTAKQVLGFLRAGLSAEESERGLVSGVPDEARADLFHEFERIVRQTLEQPEEEEAPPVGQDATPSDAAPRRHHGWWRELVPTSAPSAPAADPPRGGVRICGNAFHSDTPSVASDTQVAPPPTSFRFGF